MVVRKRGVDGLWYTVMPLQEFCSDLEEEVMSEICNSEWVPRWVPRWSASYIE